MNNSYWTLHCSDRDGTRSRSTKYDVFNDVMHAFIGACGHSNAIVVETFYLPDGTKDNRIICSYTPNGQGGGEIKF